MHKVYLVLSFFLIGCISPVFAVEGDSQSTRPSGMDAQVSEQEVQPAIWTARQAVRYALTHSPDSRVATQRIEAAKAMVNQVKAGYYPQIGLSAEYAQTNNPMYSFGNILNQGLFDQSIDFNNPGRTDDLNL